MPIEVKNVSYTYAKKTTNETLALNDVSLTINDGDFVMIVGATGSGKSTLIQTLNGLILPDRGEIHVDDLVIKPKRNKHIKDIRKKVGLVFQFAEYQLFEETLEQDVAFGPKNYKKKKEEALELAHKALLSVGLNESFFTRSPFELSGGEKRRAAIAGILALEPDILVLDEPTAGLDVQGTKEIFALLNKMNDEGKTIVVVTHDMNLVLKYAKRVVVLDEGKITFDGTPTELFSHPDNFKNMEVPLLFKMVSELKVKGIIDSDKDIRNLDDLFELLKEKNHG